MFHGLVSDYHVEPLVGEGQIGQVFDTRRDHRLPEVGRAYVDTLVLRANGLAIRPDCPICTAANIENSHARSDLGQIAIGDGDDARSERRRRQGTRQYFEGFLLGSAA
jgi:hypothetical protein